MTAPLLTSPIEVLVVGDAALAESLSVHSRHITSVDNWLDALGELAHRTAECIVGSLDPMGGRSETIAAALRELAPQARLLLVVDPALEPAAIAAVEAGFDDYLVEPLRPGELWYAIHHIPEKPAREPSPAEDLPPEEPQPQRIPALQSAPAGDWQTGDDEAKLIERLMHPRGDLAELALGVLRRRTGRADLQFANRTQPIDRPTVPVQRNGQLLGWLYVDGEAAGSAALTAHADWLGHWLALELQINSLHRMALRDELTGLWNRRYFDRFFAAVLRRAQRDRFRVTLLLFDIDDFKIYNDRYGHPAGDEVLTETARLIQQQVRKHDVVARIGGDEFAVIFWDAEAPRRQNSEHPHQVSQVARRFQKAICEHNFPKLADHAPGTLTISGGLAAFPWDGRTAEELIAIADRMLLHSKKQGKNVIALGPGALRAHNGEADDDHPAS